jgi:hypothetical protein
MLNLPRIFYGRFDYFLITIASFILRTAVFFQGSLIKANNWAGKWVVFSGSYPGSLSAFC